jgi:hypothetical protein
LGDILRASSFPEIKSSRTIALRKNKENAIPSLMYRPVVEQAHQEGEEKPLNFANVCVLKAHSDISPKPLRRSPFYVTSGIFGDLEKDDVA